MKIDSNMKPMSINVTTPRVTPDTSFSARVQSGVSTAADALGKGLGVAASMVPGGSVVSAAVSSFTSLSGASGSGSAPYFSAAVGAARAGGVPVNTTLNPGGGGAIGNNGSVSLPGGGGATGAEFNGDMQSMFSEQKKMLGLQMAMQRENQVFSTISNVLKTRHDTSKNAIGNIR